MSTSVRGRSGPGRHGRRERTSWSSIRVLEDLAGNSVGRVFDRDLTSAADDPRSGADIASDVPPRFLIHSGRPVLGWSVVRRGA